MFVTADTGTVHVTNFIQVMNLGPQQGVVLRGLKAKPDYSITTAFPPQFLPQVAAFEALSNDGPILFEDCSLEGARAVQVGGVIFPSTFQSGEPGANIEDSEAVTFVRCVIHAGDGSVENISTGDVYGADLGLYVGADSRAFLYESEVHAGDNDYYTGSDGLFAAYGSSVLLDSRVVTGGDGGPNPNFPICYDGGPGVRAQATSTVRVLDGSVQGGAGATYCSGSSGADGPAYTGLGAPTFYTGAPRDIDMPSLLSGGESTTVSYVGLPGDLVLLGVSLVPAANELPALQGVHHLAPLIGLIQVGVVPASGRIDVPWTAPTLPSGVESIGFYVQTAHLDPSGPIQLSNPDFLMVVASTL